MKQIIPLTCAQCKPMFSTVLAHMEYGRSLVLNHRTSWQSQSYMHVAVITFNPSQAHPFQTLSLMQKICGNQFFYAFVLLSVESTWTWHCHVHLSLASQPCKQTVNLSMVSHPSCTHKLHQQRAYICITQIIMVCQIAYVTYVPHCQ